MLGVKFLTGAAVGAATMYLLDPRRGHARRAQLQSRARAKVRRSKQAAERNARDEANRVRGESLERRGAGRFHPVDDRATADHLHQVLKGLDVRTDDVNVEVVDGVVRVRGQVDSPADVDTVLDCVKRQPGVDRVESLLHLPGEPAPNKEDARRVDG